MGTLRQGVRARFRRLLGVEDLQQKLDAQDALIKTLNGKLSALSEQTAKLPDRMLDPAVSQGLLTSMQRLTEGMTILDKRMTSYRSAQFVSQLSDIHPKNKTVVFAGSGYLSGNIKHAYLTCRDRMDKEGAGTCYFLPQNQPQYEEMLAIGLPCLSHAMSEYPPEQADILLRTKVLVLDNYFVPSNWRSQLPYALLHGAKTVQLWHGIPIKEIGMETAGTIKIHDPGCVEYFAACGPFDVFLAANEASRADWERKFAFKSLATIGFPRNDVFFRDISNHDLVNVDMKALENVRTAFDKKQPVIVYAPTFRDYELSAWFSRAEIDSFADYCATKGYLFYVNLHPVEQDAIVQFRQMYPRVNFISPHSDVYPILKFAHVLLTDYSSIAFDYLLQDRPIVFYRPDHEKYVSYCRRLIEENEDYLCGDMTTTVPDLIRATEAAVDSFFNPDIDPRRKARQDLANKLYDHLDGKASERLCDIIFNLLETPS